MMGKNKIIIATAVIITLALGAALLIRSRLTWKPPDDVLRLAHETNERFQSRPMVSADDQASLARAFESGEFHYAWRYGENGELPTETMSSADGLTDRQRRSLVETLADIVHLRAQADADAYAEWMRGRGCTLRGEALRKQIEEWPGRFETHAGRELKPDDTPWTIFRAAFEGELKDGRGGASRPQGLATGQNAMEVLVGVFDPDRHDLSGTFDQPFFPIMWARGQEAYASAGGRTPEWDEGMSDLHWFTGQGYNGRAHWTPPVTYKEVVERDGRALLADAHFVIRTSDAALPTRVLLYYEPQTNIWHIEGLMFINTYAYGNKLYMGPEY